MLILEWTERAEQQFLTRVHSLSFELLRTKEQKSSQVCRSSVKFTCLIMTQGKWCSECWWDCDQRAKRPPNHIAGNDIYIFVYYAEGSAYLPPALHHVQCCHIQRLIIPKLETKFFFLSVSMTKDWEIEWWTLIMFGCGYHWSPFYFQVYFIL